MSEAALNRLLAVLLVAAFATGLLTIRAGSADTWWLYAFHGVIGGVLLAASGLKLRRSLPRAIRNRRWPRLGLAAPLAVATLLSVLIGFAWTAGGRYVEIAPWTLLGWHGTFGWAVLGLVVGHLLLGGRWRLLKPRLAGMPQRPQRRAVSRRSFVAGAILAGVGTSVWAAAELLDRASATPRRFTGSRWLTGGVPPPTTFFGEGVPTIDQAAWRLRVSGVVDHPLELSLADLSALGLGELTAVLDCTGGWAMELVWRGVSMATILAAAGPHPQAHTVTVRSVTGWGTAMSMDEARGTLLATAIGDSVLPAANGAPCRLVVPDRRGLDWVKWIDEVVVS